MPSAWTRCSATSPPRSATSARRRRCSRGTGSDHVHLLVVCTAERGLCGPFNSRDRAARARARECADRPRARRSSSSASAARATSSSRRLYEKQIIEHIELRAVRSSASTNAEAIGEQDRAALRARARSTSHAVLLALQVGDRADPDRAADHPAGVRRRGRQRPAARSTNTSRTRTRSSPSSCRATSRCRFSARSWRTPPRSTARR